MQSIIRSEHELVIRRVHGLDLTVEACEPRAVAFSHGSPGTFVELDRNRARPRLAIGTRESNRGVGCPVVFLALSLLSLRPVALARIGAHRINHDRFDGVDRNLRNASAYEDEQREAHTA